jgi:hypothetical protein
MTPAKSLLAIVGGIVVASATVVAQPAPPDPGAGSGSGATTEPDPGTGSGSDAASGMIAPLPPEPPVEPPVEPEKEGPPPLSVTYDKGILFKTEDESFEARLSLRSQTRFELARSLEDGAEFQSKFSVTRIRLQLEGNVFGKDNRYKLEVGLADRGSFSYAKDFFVEKKLGGLWVRFGQWKRPFSRQELVSDFSGTFNERSIANELAGGGRDIGIAVHNDYEKTPEGIEWVVGLFNGFSGGNDRPKIATTCEQDPVSLEITCTNGVPTTLPTDFSPAGVIRVGYNKGKVKGYTEIDTDGGPLRFGVAANYKIDLADLGKGGESSVGKNLSHGIGVDAIVKVNGLDAMVGGFAMKLKSADMAFAAFAQLGYMVVPKKVHVGGRFAFREIAGTDNKELEVRAALNYLFAGHAFKIATDGGFLKVTGGGDPEIQIRSMVQLTF